MSDAPQGSRTLRLVDLWFRLAGTVTIALLGVTIAMLLAGVEGWRAPFGLAHLAALAALLPLGVALAAHAYREAGGLRSMLSRHARIVIVLALIAVTVTITIIEFDGNRALRRISNFTTVGLVLLLIVRYLRWYRRLPRSSPRRGRWTLPPPPRAGRSPRGRW